MALPVSKRALAALAICAAVFAAGWSGGVQYKRASMKRTIARDAQAELDKRAREDADLTSRSVREAHAKALEDLSEVKRLSEALEPRLKGETSALRIAELLRNLVYTRAGWVDQPGVRVVALDWMDIDHAFRKSVLDPTYGHMCAGRSITYLIALRAFGLPARKVGILQHVANLPEIPASHASVEVLIDGRWQVQDPTFNVAAADESGRAISWIEAAKILEKGGTVAFPEGGFAVQPNYSIAFFNKNAKARLDEVVRYINTSPYWDGSNRHSGVKYPEDWDGRITYANGKSISVFDTNAKGILDLLSRALM